MYSNKWVVTPRIKSYSKLKLICIPYAGGGVSAFSGWDEFIPDNIELSVINLPGRGSRFCERPYRRLSKLIEELGLELKHYLDRPFVIFGHSMGALITFELTRFLRRLNLPMPNHLFVSGGRAPHYRKQVKDILNYKMEDNEFIDNMITLGGVPEDILKEPEMMRLLLPTIKADVEMLDTYEFISEEPLPCPITAFGGFDDTGISDEMIKAWCVHTYSTFRVNMLPGDHFFINKCRETLLNLMLEDMRHSLN